MIVEGCNYSHKAMRIFKSPFRTSSHVGRCFHRLASRSPLNLLCVIILGFLGVLALAGLYCFVGLQLYSAGNLIELVESMLRLDSNHMDMSSELVWSLVRRFDQPQLFKPFVSRCEMKGNIEIGSVREVNVKSGLPATRSTERLELLDDNEHILSVRFVGGDHRLQNYSSILTVHPEVIDGRPGTLVIESFVVDVPEGNTKDETCYFVEALLKCNLKSLAEVSERLVIKDQTEPLDR